MEEAIEKKYAELERVNLDLMIKHYNQDEIPDEKNVEEIRTNYVLLTKLGQMLRKIKNISKLNY